MSWLTKTPYELVELKKMEESSIKDLSVWIKRMIELQTKLEQSGMDDFKSYYSKRSLGIKIGRGLTILKKKAKWNDNNWNKMLDITSKYR